MEVDEGRADAIASIFESMDADHDGMVTFQEFMAAVETDVALKAAIFAPLSGLSREGKV